MRIFQNVKLDTLLDGERKPRNKLENKFGDQARASAQTRNTKQFILVCNQSTPSDTHEPNVTLE